ncbi:hypothetical protein Zmor_025207 [Zophobas morio]|nr:hypothetical protein Zmor_025207 [Zophobas morio]
MSFLNELRTKRHCLKPTTTTLTYLDGRKFEESGPDALVEIPRTQFGFIVDAKPDNVPAKIVDYVYLGSQDCCDPQVLGRFDINNVLSVGVDAPSKCEKIAYRFVQCLDLPQTNLLDVLKESVCFIQDAV